MREWCVILDMGGGVKIPLHLKAKESVHALTKAAVWCQTEKYQAISMEAIPLMDFGIVEVDEER